MRIYSEDLRSLRCFFFFGFCYSKERAETSVLSLVALRFALRFAFASVRSFERGGVVPEFPPLPFGILGDNAQEVFGGSPLGPNNPLRNAS